MTDPEREALAAMVSAAVLTAFEARPRDPVHAEHHEWVKTQIAKEKARADFWQTLAAKSLPAIVWTLLVAGATGLWRLVSTHVAWH
jgi:hypothetical protein